MMLFIDRPHRAHSRAVTAASLCTMLLATLVLAGGAQAVPPPSVLLATAGQYAVLAGTGVTNTGASTISGDVGSSATSTETGFAACPAADCVTLTGANHTDPNPNDATTQGAKSALTTAYDDAAGRSPTTVLTELGGQTLVAGVYGAASGTFGMTGTLVLDGQNNVDSVFIFQTASTLITGGSGNVTLINGAQACNVFWKVGSAATLGAGSSFRGTILAHDNISLGDGVIVDGRLLAGEQASGTGAVTLIHDTITMPSTCVSQADLDAAEAAATQAAAAAAQASATAQAAATQAAAAQLAAANAAQVAQTAEASTAAANASLAATVASANASAAKAAAAKAAAAAKVVLTKAHAAKVAGVKAAAAKAIAAAKVAAAHARAAKAAAAKAVASSTVASFTHAKPALKRVGLTG
jgi:hypothetical protein